jgi:hypothetical protein
VRTDVKVEKVEPELDFNRLVRQNMSVVAKKYRLSEGRQLGEGLTEFGEGDDEEDKYQF